jgi:hypothetical protein
LGGVRHLRQSCPPPRFLRGARRPVNLTQTLGQSSWDQSFGRGG